MKSRQCPVERITVLVAVLLVSAESSAQRPLPESSPAAPFTATQAAQGKTVYAQACASCHGRNLSGSEFATALNGNSFSQNWGGKPAGGLFTFIRTRMPPAAAGSLTPEVTAQLVAYLMQVNGVPVSETALSQDPTVLASLTIPRGPVAPTPPMMPLSPLSPPIPKLILPTPLEDDGVLFVAGWGDSIQALNAATGDLLWQYSRALPGDARLSVRRNLGIYRDRLFVATSDDHVVALDVKTGTVVWDSPVADYKAGWQVTGGPIIAKGKVMQGVAGQSPGGGWIVALDADTGREAWRFHTIARPGEPGGESWNGLPLEKRSGASVWTAGSYDPQLNLAYFGVGQTYDTGPLLHLVRKPGIGNDGLYTDSTLALDPDTGRLVWHFQHVRNDQWDLDWAFEQQVISLPGGGSQHKLIVTSGKMGIYEAMDAATGKYVFSQDLGIQNVIGAIDSKTGEKSINPAVVLGDGKPHTICPHPGGGRNWIATSYNATTKILYTPMVESCMDLIPAPPGERGNLSSGVNWTIRPRPDTDGKYGRIEAFNLETRKVLWIDRQRAPQTTCILATAGGVVFAGALDRYLKAYDDTTGAVLWQVRMSDVPSSCPISYSVKGRQYVAVVLGNGGAATQTFLVIVPETQNPTGHGSSVLGFELTGKRTAAHGGRARHCPAARTRHRIRSPRTACRQ